MKGLCSLLISSVFFFIVSQALAESSITCATLADVYIDQRYPDTNLNAKTRVLISMSASYGIARGLWKFDIPAGLDPAQIQSAVLHLSGSIHTGGGDAMDVCCYSLNASFGEDNATWNLLAGGDYDTTLCSAGSVPAGTDWEATIDVTALLQQKLDKVRAHGMLMKKNDETAAGYQSIASRESTDAEDFAAYIVISDMPATSTTSTLSPSTTTTTITSTTTSTAVSAMAKWWENKTRIICPAIADLSIDEWKPDENLNNLERIILSTNHNIHHGIARGLFQFDIPRDMKQTAVRRAEICLSACHHCGGGNGGEVGFYALNEPFQENSDTWNSLGGGCWEDAVSSQADLPGGTNWNTAVKGEPPANVKCLDVTGLMKGNLEKARGNGIMMRFLDETQSPSTWGNVASRETTDPLDFAPYMVIRKKLCPAEVVFGDEPAALDLLRRFRDEVLSTTAEGRRWTAFYYRYADATAELLENNPELQRQSRAAVEQLLPQISRLVDGKAVNRWRLRREARALIELFKRNRSLPLKASLPLVFK